MLVVGPRGLRRSEDAGQTFDQVRARAVRSAQLTGITMARANGTLFVWGPSNVARSDDDGATWIAVPKPGRSARELRALRTAQVAFASATHRPAARHAPGASGARRTPAADGRC